MNSEKVLNSIAEERMIEDKEYLFSRLKVQKANIAAAWAKNQLRMLALTIRDREACPKDYLADEIERIMNGMEVL